MIGNAIAGFLGTGVAASTTAYESIATSTVGAGGSTSITFSSIPATYTHLQVRLMNLSNGSAGDVRVQFNSDTGNNYSKHGLYGSGTAVTANGSASGAFAYGGISGSTTAPGVAVIDILDYANTNKYKTVRNLSGYDLNAAGGYVELQSGAWLNTAAITSITIFTSGVTYAQYSSFALYGIKGV
jgi:hypothetical protein